MATVSAALSTSILVNEVNFLSPSTAVRRLRISLPARELKRSSVYLGRRILAAKREDGTAVVDEEEDEYLDKLNRSLNGNSNGSYCSNGSVVEEFENGSVGAVESESESFNGSLVKYVNGNGNGGAVDSVGELVELKVENEKKKKSVEEIGQEEAWFKGSGADQLEVCNMYMHPVCAEYHSVCIIFLELH